MKPSQLTQLLAHAIPARLPILIVGAPGIGKTSIVGQAAVQAEADLILSHPAVSDPTDVKGLPWVGADGESATFLPFGDLAAAMRAERPTVWFLDDLGQAPPSTQASFMQLILARQVNGHTLPDHVTFVAATNRRTDRAGVSGILEPVKSRFAAIVELEADVDEWCSWALGQDYIPAELIAFLRFRPELLSAFNPSADLTNSPTPRTWAHAARWVGADLPEPVRAQALAGAVGEGAATEFLAFLRIARELPSIDAILLDPGAAPIPESPAALYAVATGLAMRANESTLGRVLRYTERLIQAGRGEFATLLVRDAVRRDAALSSTPEFVRLAAGELGQLIVGAA